jgi:hypothetical protein
MGIPDYIIYAFYISDLFGGNLSITSCHHDEPVRVCAFGAVYIVSSLSVSPVSDRAGVYHIDVCFLGKRDSFVLALGKLV